MSNFLYLQKQKAEELLAMSDAFLAVGAGKHTDNIYYCECMSALTALRGELSSSIAYHRQKGLALESNSIDVQFNAMFVDWRTLIEAHSSVKSLTTWEACVKVSDILERIDRDLYKRSKPVQISLFDSFIEETVSLHTATGFEELFNKLAAVHTELKAVEQSRAEVKTDSQEPPTKVGEKVIPVLSLIHAHLEGYSYLGNSSYGETLEAVHAQVAPIVTAVKARLTKGKNSSEAAETEE